jgi:serine/threonine-protein kinase
MKFSSTCPNCGETLFRDDAHCPKCGSRRSELVLKPGQLKGATRALEATSAAGDGEVLRCSSCGAPRLASDLFCTVCGMPMVDGEPTPPPEGSTPERSTPSPPPTPDPTPTPAGDLDGWTEIRHQLEEATLGEFEIVKELGRGGMAAVYLARDLALGRNVAIKVMAPGLLLGQGMVDRFRQEAVTIANLHHPNIITIHTVRQAGTLHFFVMQLVEGGSLEDILERGESIPVALAQTVLYQLGTGLAHAHRSGVIHRDIKPANVLLDDEGNAILTDFGIAKVTTATNLTQTGSTIGTPAYMSPEQCKAAELTSASDQYSLGVVAYEMLVGRAPFAGSPFEIMQAHTGSSPQGIREQREDCPPELEAAVLRMLAKDPADRFPSVAEAIEAVGGYLPGPQDPLRKELARLVRPDAPGATAGREALTPIPAKTPVPRPAAKRAPASPKRKRARLPLLIGGVVGLGAIATVVVLTSLPSSPTAGSDPAVQEEAPVSSVLFENPSESLVVGATVTVMASVQDAEGRRLVDQPVSWSSDDPAVATVEGSTEEVVVTGVAPGLASIQAEVGGVLASFTVEVTELAVGELTVTASRRELPIGERVALSAMLTDESGERVADPEFSWSSSDPGVAQVDPQSGPPDHQDIWGKRGSPGGLRTRRWPR